MRITSLLSATLYSIIIGGLCLLSACHPKGSASNFKGDAEPLKYSQLLQIERLDSMVIATVKSPWNSEGILQRYIIVPKSAPLPQLRPEGVVVRTPLQRAVMHNSVHAYLALLLGQVDKVGGLCDVDYVMNAELRQLVADSTIYNAGSSIKFNLERNIKEGADAIFASPLEDVSHDALSAMGIPVIECADYMECHPLGRAEWMKFFGLLFDCKESADSLFTEVSSAYLSLSEQNKQLQHRPRLMVDKEQGAAWYMPGGASYLGTLFADAGADYVLSHHASAGSIAVGRERAFVMGKDADVWLIKYADLQPLTYQQLQKENALYATFKSWKDRRIYGCNTFEKDFYERIPFQPHLLLKEITDLLHNSEVSDLQNAYYQPLEE